MIPNKRRTAAVLAQPTQYHASDRVGTWDKSTMAKRDEWQGVAEAAPAIGDTYHTNGFTNAGELLTQSREAGREAALVPCVSNTRFTISQQNRKDLGDTLRPSSDYLITPPLTVVSPEQLDIPHWTETDPARFASLPQGGGGVDWLTVTVYGDLTETGSRLRTRLAEAKTLCKGADAEARAKEMGFRDVLVKKRKSVLLEHPNDAGRVIEISHTGTGAGRSYQPILLHCDGIAVRYGRISSSYPTTGGNHGPIAFIEIPGAVFLRNGEAKSLLMAERILHSIGIQIHSVRPGRCDAAADLPNQDIEEFTEAIKAHKYVTRAEKRIATYNDPQTGAPTGYDIASGCVRLRVYDKLRELALRSDTQKLALMQQNRWGGNVTKAVRVEFQFILGKNRSRSYKSFEELAQGLGELIGWAMMTWFRLCDVKDRTHTDRAQILDCWLRALHAFAFWSGRLLHRPIPRIPEAAPCEQLLRQAGGVFASAVARAGIVPDDDQTLWTILASFHQPGELVAKCIERSKQFQAVYGTMGERGRPVRLHAGDNLQSIDTGQGSLAPSKQK